MDGDVLEDGELCDLKEDYQANSNTQDTSPPVRMAHYDGDTNSPTCEVQHVLNSHEYSDRNHDVMLHAVPTSEVWLESRPGDRSPIRTPTTVTSADGRVVFDNSLEDGEICDEQDEDSNICQHLQPIVLDHNDSEYSSNGIELHRELFQVNYNKKDSHSRSSPIITNTASLDSQQFRSEFRSRCMDSDNSEMFLHQEDPCCTDTNIHTLLTPEVIAIQDDSHVSNCIEQKRANCLDVVSLQQLEPEESESKSRSRRRERLSHTGLPDCRQFESSSGYDSESRALSIDCQQSLSGKRYRSMSRDSTRATNIDTLDTGISRSERKIQCLSRGPSRERSRQRPEKIGDDVTMHCQRSMSGKRFRSRSPDSYRETNFDTSNTDISRSERRFQFRSRGPLRGRDGQRRGQTGDQRRFKHEDGYSDNNRRSRGGRNGARRAIGCRGRGRGGRGTYTSNTRNNTAVKKKDTLDILFQKDPSEIIMRLGVDKDSLKAFIHNAMKEATEEHGRLNLLLKVLNKAFMCESMPSMVLNIINGLKDEDLNFIHDSISHIDSNLDSEDGITGCIESVDGLLRIVNRICEVTPSSIVFIMGAYDFLHGIVERIHSIQGNDTDTMMKLFKQLEDNKTICIQRKMPNNNIPVKNRHNDINNPPECFRDISIFPQSSDIITGAKPFLRANKAIGSYENLDHYLDVQFRLLREDFIGSLRDGIAKYIGQVGTNKKQHDIRIYDRVRILSPICGNGLNHIISFDTSKMKHIRWNQTKRLIFGSLLCLSPDNFKTCYFAVVVNSDLSTRYKGQVHVKFENDANIIKTLMGSVFIMAEATAYFEAYRHVLASLQRIQEDELPFESYIVRCQKDILPPKYLRDNPNATLDLRPLHDSDAVLYGWSHFREPGHLMQPRERTVFSETSEPLQNIQVSGEVWPHTGLLHLDESQLKAVKTALTREFSIIQGPPGCGKTYIGLKIVKALLHNKRTWSGGPLLVMCYTNHALDQFMAEICQTYDGDIVRVGGRSSSEAMVKHGLYHIRESFRKSKHIPGHIHIGKRKTRATMMNLKMELNFSAQKIKCLQDNVVHEHALYNEIGSTLFKQFTWTRRQKHTLPHYLSFLGDSVMVEWLGIVDILREIQSQVRQFGTKSIVEKDHGRTVFACPQEINVEPQEDCDMKFENDEKLDEDMKASMNAFIKEHIALSKDTLYVQPEWIHRTHWMNIVRWERLELTDRLNDKLNSFNPMSNEELSSATDIFSIRFPHEQRWRLCQTWVNEKCRKLNRTIEKNTGQFEEAYKRCNEARMQEDKHIMEMADVIGMTTTCAAKHQTILREIKPKIVIIEEAAEVFESHIISNLTKGCEQLILIGDHKQLRPKPNVYKLETDYNLDISLFERMIKNGIQYDCLETQHRMRPEIADNLRFIYNNLQDHCDVHKYENVMGVGRNMFFINHNENESRDNEISSFQNEHEATYTVALCKYFLLQGYPPNKVTVMTTYKGQMYAIKKYMGKEPDTFANVLVTVVDNYQGEENDIILLSLVRSNVEKRVGFLKKDNRVCVALSRAKKGLFVIGNFDLLLKASDLWNNIIRDVKQKGVLATALPLICQNHPEEGISAEFSDDFLKAPEGGCRRMCDMRLDCGHVCQKVCHVIDSDHKEAVRVCQKRCEKKCKNGHPCNRKCCEKCLCMQLIIITLPKCQHVIEVPCSYDQETYQCEVIVTRHLPKCGHQVSVMCKENMECFQCTFKCGQTLDCGHTCSSECRSVTHESQQQTYLGTESVCPVGHREVCQTKCGMTLECVHTCEGTCGTCIQGRMHIQCGKHCSCNVICGHKCSGKCGECKPCEVRCERLCFHNNCSHICKEMCDPCKEPCVWRCGHYQCDKLCYEPCDRPRCDKPCDKLLPCRHPCIGLCGDTCPTKCRICDKDIVHKVRYGNEDDINTRFVQLEDCGHLVQYDKMDAYMDMDEVVVCLKRCPVCDTPIRNCLRYKGIVNKTLQQIEEVKYSILHKYAFLDNDDLLIHAIGVQRQMQLLYETKDNLFARNRRIMNILNQFRIKLSVHQQALKISKNLKKTSLINLNAIFSRFFQFNTDLISSYQWLLDLERELCRYLDYCVIEVMRNEHLPKCSKGSAKEVSEKLTLATGILLQRKIYDEKNRNLLQIYVKDLNSCLHSSFVLERVALEVKVIDQMHLANSVSDFQQRNVDNMGIPEYHLAAYHDCSPVRLESDDSDIEEDNDDSDIEEYHTIMYYALEKLFGKIEEHGRPEIKERNMRKKDDEGIQTYAMTKGAERNMNGKQAGDVLTKATCDAKGKEINLNGAQGGTYERFKEVDSANEGEKYRNERGVSQCSKTSDSTNTEEETIDSIDADRTKKTNNISREDNTLTPKANNKNAMIASMSSADQPSIEYDQPLDKDGQKQINSEIQLLEEPVDQQTIENHTAYSITKHYQKQTNVEGNTVPQHIEIEKARERNMETDRGNIFEVTEDNQLLIFSEVNTSVVENQTNPDELCEVTQDNHEESETIEKLPGLVIKSVHLSGRPYFRCEKSKNHLMPLKAKVADEKLTIAGEGPNLRHEQRKQRSLKRKPDDEDDRELRTQIKQHKGEFTHTVQVTKQLTNQKRNTIHFQANKIVFDLNADGEHNIGSLPTSANDTRKVGMRKDVSTYHNPYTHLLKDPITNEMDSSVPIHSTKVSTQKNDERSRKQDVKREHTTRKHRESRSPRYSHSHDRNSMYSTPKQSHSSSRRSSKSREYKHSPHDKHNSHKRSYSTHDNNKQSYKRSENKYEQDSKGSEKGSSSEQSRTSSPRSSRKGSHDKTRNYPKRNSDQKIEDTNTVSSNQLTSVSYVHGETEPQVLDERQHQENDLRNIIQGNKVHDDDLRSCINQNKAELSRKRGMPEDDLRHKIKKIKTRIV